MKILTGKYLTSLLLSVVCWTFCRAAGIHTLENQQLAMTFDCNRGIVITRIDDKAKHFSFLNSPSAFFSYSIDHGAVLNAVDVLDVHLSNDGRTLKIGCRPAQQKSLRIDFSIELALKSDVVIVTTVIQNSGPTARYLKLLLPNIGNLTVPGFNNDSSRMLGMIPQEIGGVVTMNKGLTIGTQFIDSTTQLPSAFNVMEVADLYDREGNGGIYFADMDGDVSRNIPPIQFCLSPGHVSGHWASTIEPGKSIKTSRLAIGLHHSGDYHQSVDFYTGSHRSTWKFPEAPAWFLEAGAIWSTGEEGSGGAYEIWPAKNDLRLTIGSFNELPVLYQQARAMGTNIFYLNDYWEGDGRTIVQYLNKGDYIPRSDLGGPAALKKGIEGIHAQGGKVIMYVEPFIIAASSEIGKSKGALWAARDENGVPWMPYEGNYVMASPNPDWQAYVVGIARRLVADYGADGVFLDSWGWRYNLSFKNNQQNVLWSGQDWNKGVHDLADKVLAAIRELRKDAIVVSESAGGQMGLHENGGLSADFVWGSGANQGRIIASPVRYGMPEVHFFSNGDNLNQLVQVFAAGHGLALNGKWIHHAEYIRELLEIRRIYKDALIYGKQTYQPSTGNMHVGAYLYKGSVNEVLTIVNTVDDTLAVSLQLHDDAQGSVWSDALTGEMFRSNGEILSLSMLGSHAFSNGLRVLVRNKE